MKKKQAIVKKVLMEITIDENDTLEWTFSPELSRFHMYAVYGLLELIREELKYDFMDSFEKQE